MATSGALDGFPLDSYTVFVIGASGDLAKKKTYPSLYELFVNGLLPAGRTTIVGYARSDISDAKFRDTIRVHLPATGDAAKLEAFLAICCYRSGGYDDDAAFGRAVEFGASQEAVLSQTGKANRLFYLAIPPSVFTAAAATAHASGLVGWWSSCLCVCLFLRAATLVCVPALQTSTGWNRVVVEKPFGHDAGSSADLSRELAKYFSEDQIFRIGEKGCGRGC